MVRQKEVVREVLSNDFFVLIEFNGLIHSNSNQKRYNYLLLNIDFAFLRASLYSDFVS